MIFSNGEGKLAENDVQQAIALIKAGKKNDAVQVLKNILKTDRDNESAWLWLAYCVEIPEEKIYCFQEALRINPNNEKVKKVLEQLEPTPTPQPFNEKLNINTSNQNTSEKVEQVQVPPNQTQPPSVKSIQSQNAREGRKKSNNKIILIADGVILLLCILGVIFVYLNKNKLPGWASTSTVQANAAIQPAKTNKPAGNTPMVSATLQPTNTPQPTGTTPAGSAILQPTNTPQPTDNTPAGSTTLQPTDTLQPGNTASSIMLPEFSHVIIIIFENKEERDIIGKSTLPNFNNLAQQYALLTNYYAIRHPSLPNYIALTSGYTQGITSDCTDCFVNQTNLMDLIENSGRTWKAYMEGMPAPCALGNIGEYAQKHDPFVYYDDVLTNSARCQQDVVPFSQFASDLKNNQLPSFAWITPNMCNDAHDCPAETADEWLGPEVNKILQSAAFDQNSLLAITFDEGTTNKSCCSLPSSAGGNITTLLISKLVKPGFKDNTPYSHYSLLKTIETSWGLQPLLGHAADSQTTLITAPWK